MYLRMFGSLVAVRAIVAERDETLMRTAALIASSSEVVALNGEAASMESASRPHLAASACESKRARALTCSRFVQAGNRCRAGHYGAAAAAGLSEPCAPV